MPRMGKIDEDWNKGFENCSAERFFKVDPCSLQLQKSDLWFCHLSVISLLTLSSIVMEGE